MSKNWTYEETILALYLYCIIPFNRVSSKHTDIIKLSGLLSRSPNSIKMKIGNFGSFDPLLKARGIVGLQNISKLDKLVWDEFHNNWDQLVLKADEIIKGIEPDNPNFGIIEVNDFSETITEKSAITKARLKQSFFRKTILASYNNTCCITGMNIPELLVASHIVPWSENKELRLNPTNGLCLNAIHDRAFDKGLMTITPDYKIVFSERLKDANSHISIKLHLLNYEGKKIQPPERFHPSKDYLEFHNKNIFKNE